MPSFIYTLYVYHARHLYFKSLSFLHNFTENIHIRILLTEILEDILGFVKNTTSITRADITTNSIESSTSVAGDKQSKVHLGKV